MDRRLLTLLTFLMVGLTEGATVYKWVDENGKTHYSELPPPGGAAKQVISVPNPNGEEDQRAQEGLKRLLEQQRRREEIRGEDQDEKRQREAAKQKEQVERKQLCIRAREHLHTLEMQRPVYGIDEKGEYVYLDDKARPAEIERYRKAVGTYCES